MIITTIAVLTRIFSNSMANVYQKRLAAQGVNPFFINFVMYMGLSVCCLPFAFGVNWLDFGSKFWLYSVLCGLFGALGNSYLVKALKDGDLSVLGPINAYKSVVAMLFGMILLREFPSVVGIVAVGLIIWGSYFVFDTQEEGFSLALLKRQDIRYRIYALVFTAIEAVFIKNVIAQSDVWAAFTMWCVWGAVFTGIILSTGKIVPPPKPSPVERVYFKCFMLIILMGLMQLSTNYVFLKMNVSYGLALFQLSTILSVILGWRYFNEGQIRKKFLGSLIMVLGAVILILYK